MAKVYVTYYVPAGSESLLPATTPATAPLVPYPGDATASPPTAYGGNTLLDDTSPAYGSLIGTLGTIPGSGYRTRPYRQWSYQTDWLGWLAGNGLQPQQQVGP